MKKREKVTFKYFEVFFFGRCLGTDKVPESGNNPLGMENSHFFTTKSDICAPNPVTVLHNGDNVATSTPKAKQDIQNNLISIHKKNCDRDSLQSILSIDYTVKSFQPLNSKQRIKCLKDAGVEFIKDQLWTDEGKGLIKLRLQRQQVGCKCIGKNNCDPYKCICSKEGIPCQSDGNKFPCKCGVNCGNTSGKKIYSHLRIKYHYQHTFERNLNDENDQQFISKISIKGDCHICNDISEESLQKLFGEPVVPNRKRVANTKSKEHSKVDKSKQSYLEPLEIKKPASNEMITSFYPETNDAQSLNYADLFTVAMKNERNTEKENLGESEKFKKLSHNRILSFINPVSERSTLSPIQIPLVSIPYVPMNDSQTNNEWSQMSSCDLSEILSPIIAENVTECNTNSYWNSFLNKTTCEVKFQSPMIINDKSILNPISLAPDITTPNIFLTREKKNYYTPQNVDKPTKVSNEESCLCSPLLMMDINVDNFRSSLSPYKLRHSNLVNRFYYESPFSKIAKKKRDSKQYFRLSKKKNLVKEKAENSFIIKTEDIKTLEEDSIVSLSNIVDLSSMEFLNVATINIKNDVDIEPELEGNLSTCGDS